MSRSSCFAGLYSVSRYSSPLTLSVTLALSPNASLAMILTLAVALSVLQPCHYPNRFSHSLYTLQRLVRGPFNPARIAGEEARIIGVPKNLKHAILSLPHAYAPRLDAAVHLRCQFRHFEQVEMPRMPLSFNCC